MTKLKVEKMSHLPRLTEELHALPHATYIAPADGKKIRFLKIPVRVVVTDPMVTDLINDACVFDLETWILARSAKEALEYISERLGGVPCCEIRTYGPRGGKYTRYGGYQSAVAHRLTYPMWHQWARDMICSLMGDTENGLKAKIRGGSLRRLFMELRRDAGEPADIPNESV